MRLQFSRTYQPQISNQIEYFNIILKESTCYVIGLIGKHLHKEFDWNILRHVKNA